MNFPFTVSTKIKFDQKELGITSELYILSKINSYMEQFRMVQDRISQNEMHYYKLMPIRTYKRQDFLRNLIVKVECTDDSVQITLKSITIHQFLIALGAVIVPLFLPLPNLMFHALIFLFFAIVPYGIRIAALSMTKSEIRATLLLYKR